MANAKKREKRVAVAPDEGEVALDERAAAGMLGLSPYTLSSWRRDAEGPPYVKVRPGRNGRIVYLLPDLKSWLQARRVVPPKRQEAR
jgi:hypothetical protein